MDTLTVLSCFQMHVKHSLIFDICLLICCWLLRSNLAMGRCHVHLKHIMKLECKMGCHLESSTWLLRHATATQCWSSAMGWAPNRNLTSQSLQRSYHQIPNQYSVWETNWASIAELTAAWMVAVQHAKMISNQMKHCVLQTDEQTLLNAPSQTPTIRTVKPTGPIPNELFVFEPGVSLRERQCHWRRCVWARFNFLNLPLLVRNMHA